MIYYSIKKRKMNFKKNTLGIIFLLMFLNQAYIQARVLIQHPLQRQIEKTIALLCLKFKMTNDIDIKFLSDDRMDNSSMFYIEKTHSIILSDTLDKKYPLSFIYKTLLHEFRHHIQENYKMFEMRTGKTKLATFYDPCILKEADKRKNVLWFPNDSSTILLFNYMPKNKEQKEYVKMIKKLHDKNSYDQLFKPIELDADLFAIKQISCPICYDIALCMPIDKGISKEGYVGLNFMKKYKAEKQQNPCCKAHTFNNNIRHKIVLNKLKRILGLVDYPEYIDSEIIQELCCMDEACGPFSERYTK